MSDARDIARLLIGLGWYPEEPEESVYLCPLRLQKLLYYVQGWHLGLLGKPLFHQPIEAWVNGPVVVDVYREYQGRSSYIVPNSTPIPNADLTNTQRDLIQSVWQEYARYTPRQLVVMTHEEPAWKEARIGLAPQDKSSKQLSLETMASYFRTVAKKMVSQSHYPMPDPIEMWQEEEDVELQLKNMLPASDVMKQAREYRASLNTR